MAAPKPASGPGSGRRPPPKGGRRPPDYDLATIERIAALGGPHSEIAHGAKLSVTQLRRLLKKKEVAEAVERGRIAGNLLLRQAVWNKAVRDRHWPALEFLARAVLGIDPNQAAGAGTNWLVETRPKAASVDAWAEQFAPMRATPPGTPGGDPPTSG